MAIKLTDVGLDTSTLRAMTQVAEDAKRFSRQLEAALGASSLGESASRLSALYDIPRLDGVQSQFAKLAALGTPPDLSTGLAAVLPLASQISDFAKLSDDLTSLSTLGKQIAEASELSSTLAAALEAPGPLVNLGLSTSIEEALKGYEASGLLGTQRILEEFGALGLADGLEDQVNALASLIGRGSEPVPPFDADVFRPSVYQDFDDQGDDDVGVQELPAPRAIVRIVGYCDDALTSEGFEGASDEFDRAIDRYESGEAKEAMAWSLNALESTLKTICDRRGWPYPKSAPAKKLIEVVFTNNLVDKAHQAQFAALRSLLESGLPTVANPFRHGQGSFVVATPDHVAAYAIHLCAANIVFLLECYRILPD